jgi:hypothetical protein
VLVATLQPNPTGALSLDYAQAAFSSTLHRVGAKQRPCEQRLAPCAIEPTAAVRGRQVVQVLQIPNVPFFCQRLRQLARAGLLLVRAAFLGLALRPQPRRRQVRRCVQVALAVRVEGNTGPRVPLGPESNGVCGFNWLYAVT